MIVKQAFLRNVLLLFFVGLLVSAMTLISTRAVAEEFGESPHQRAEKEDPHARFRDGSRGNMAEMMGKMKSPHSKSRKKGVHPPFSAQGLKESLDLDDTQAKKIGHILSEYRKDVILKEAKLRVAQIELDETVGDRDFVVDEVKKKAKKRASAATVLTMVRVNALAEARDVLSKEQFHKFMGMLSHQMSGHGRKGKHGVHGGGRHGRFSSGHDKGSPSSHGRRSHGASSDSDYE